MASNTTKAEAVAVMRRTLAAEYNITEPELDLPGVIVTEAIDLPGRRAFIRPAKPFNAVTIGGATIISTSRERMDAVSELVAGSTRDLVFKSQILSLIHI